MSDNSTFLGTGWAFPPSFKSQGAMVSTASGNDDIRQSLEILLSTRLEERNMRFDYGCELQDFLFSEINQRLVLRLRDMISNAILHHEPRIKVDNVGIAEDEEERGLLIIDIEYTIRATNTRYNMVYPFYVNEATEL